jgi:predicted SAM-dependent methyltransferase
MINTLRDNILTSTLFISVHNKYRNRTRRIFRQNKSHFKNKSGIEIGGPSQVFSTDGPLPVYGVAGKIDNVNYSSETFWGNTGEGKNFVISSSKENGYQFISEASDLIGIKDNSYDFLLSSHVIEHLANPLKAVNEWKRIIKTGGYMVIIAPDRQRTYDHKRPLTSFEHIMEDYLNETDESDVTHLREIIELHDLSLDTTVDSFEDHEKRTRDNLNTRIAHHHTFDTDLLIRLVRYCKLTVTGHQTFKPFHLAVIARKTDAER